MEKTFQYHQQLFAGLELEIYNDLLKKDKIFLQCILVQYMCTLSTMKRLWEERLAIHRPSNISYTGLGLTIAKLKKLFLIHKNY